MKSEDIIKVENLEKIELMKFTIRWNLTYLCNYKCDFCIQGDSKTHIAKSKNESIDIRRKICKNLISFIENELNDKYNYLDIYLLGGEITILPDFLEILEKIVNCSFNGKIVIRIVTNLSTKIEVIKEIIKIFKTKRDNIRELRLNASYYKEFAKEDEFMEKVKLLNSNNKNPIFRNLKKVHTKLEKLDKKKYFSKITKIINKKINKVYVKVNYPLCKDEDYDEYLNFKKKYKKYKIDISFIIIKLYKTSISEELKKKIINENHKSKKIKVTFNNGEEFFCSNNNKISLKLDGEDRFYSKGYLCDIGINSISIDNFGLVSRCTCCKKETIIGDITSGNIVLPTQKIICPAITCDCSYYGIIEKNGNYSNCNENVTKK